MAGVIPQHLLEALEASIASYNKDVQVADGVSVHDGDTATIEAVSPNPLRFGGVDTRELGRNGKPDEPTAKLARKYLADFLVDPANRETVALTGETSYNRDVAISEPYNRDVLKAGLANPTRFSSPADHAAGAQNALHMNGANVPMSDRQKEYAQKAQEERNLGGNTLGPDANDLGVTRYGMNDFGKGVQRGHQNLMGMIGALKNATGQVFEDEELQQLGVDEMLEAAVLAANYPARVGSFDNVDSFADLGTRVVELLGEQVAIMAPSLLAGGAGGLAARAAVGKALSNRIGTRVLTLRQTAANRAGPKVGRQADGKFASMRKTTDELMALEREAMGAMARGTKIGAGAGFFGSETAIGAGDINRELLENGIDDEAGIAFAMSPFYGALSTVGITGAMLPFFKSLTAGGQKSLIGAMAKGFGLGAATGMPVEGSTEALQEMILLASRKMADPSFEVFTAENMHRVQEAALSGAALAGVLGGAGGATRAYTDYKFDAGFEQASEDYKKAGRPGGRHEKDGVEYMPKGWTFEGFTAELEQARIDAEAQLAADKAKAAGATAAGAAQNEPAHEDFLDDDGDGPAPRTQNSGPRVEIEDVAASRQSANEDFLDDDDARATEDAIDQEDRQSLVDGEDFLDDGEGSGGLIIPTARDGDRNSPTPQQPSGTPQQPSGAPQQTLPPVRRVTNPRSPGDNAEANARWIAEQRQTPRRIPDSQHDVEAEAQAAADRAGVPEPRRQAEAQLDDLVRSRKLSHERVMSGEGDWAVFFSPETFAQFKLPEIRAWAERHGAAKGKERLNVRKLPDNKGYIIALNKQLGELAERLDANGQRHKVIGAVTNIADMTKDGQQPVVVQVLSKEGLPVKEWATPGLDTAEHNEQLRRAKLRAGTMGGTVRVVTPEAAVEQREEGAAQPDEGVARDATAEKDDRLLRRGRQQFWEGYEEPEMVNDAGAAPDAAADPDQNIDAEADESDAPKAEQPELSTESDWTPVKYIGVGGNNFDSLDEAIASDTAYSGGRGVQLTRSARTNEVKTKAIHKRVAALEEADLHKLHQNGVDVTLRDEDGKPVLDEEGFEQFDPDKMPYAYSFKFYKDKDGNERVLIVQEKRAGDATYDMRERLDAETVENMRTYLDRSGTKPTKEYFSERSKAAVRVTRPDGKTIYVGTNNLILWARRHLNRYVEPNMTGPQQVGAELMMGISAMTQLGYKVEYYQTDETKSSVQRTLVVGKARRVLKRHNEDTRAWHGLPLSGRMAPDSRSVSEDQATVNIWSPVEAEAPLTKEQAAELGLPFDPTGNTKTASVPVGKLVRWAEEEGLVDPRDLVKRIEQINRSTKAENRRTSITKAVEDYYAQAKSRAIGELKKTGWSDKPRPADTSRVVIEEEWKHEKTGRKITSPVKSLRVPIASFFGSRFNYKTIARAMGGRGEKGWKGTEQELADARRAVYSALAERPELRGALPSMLHAYDEEAMRQQIGRTDTGSSTYYRDAVLLRYAEANGLADPMAVSKALVQVAARGTPASIRTRSMAKLNAYTMAAVSAAQQHIDQNKVTLETVRKDALRSDESLSEHRKALSTKLLELSADNEAHEAISAVTFAHGSGLWDSMFGESIGELTSDNRGENQSVFNDSLFEELKGRYETANQSESAEKFRDNQLGEGDFSEVRDRGNVAATEKYASDSRAAFWKRLAERKEELKPEIEAVREDLGTKDSEAGAVKLVTGKNLTKPERKAMAFLHAFIESLQQAYGLKDGITVMDLDSARDHHSGQFRGLSDNGPVSGRYWSDGKSGEHMIVVTGLAKYAEWLESGQLGAVASLAAHEYGHHFFEGLFQQLPFAGQARINAAYNADPNHDYYKKQRGRGSDYLGMVEWMADQFVKYNLSDRKGMVPPLQRLFKKAVKAFKTLLRMIMGLDNLTDERSIGRMFPSMDGEASPEMAAFLDAWHRAARGNNPALSSKHSAPSTKEEAALSAEWLKLFEQENADLEPSSNTREASRKVRGMSVLNSPIPVIADPKAAHNQLKLIWSRAKRMGGSAKSGFDAVFSSTNAWLKEHGFGDLARELFLATGDTPKDGDFGYVQDVRTQMGVWQNRFGKALLAVKDDVALGKKVSDELNRMDGNYTTPEAKEIRKGLDEFFVYLQKATSGTIKFRKNFYPRRWDVEAIRANEEGFFRALAKVGMEGEAAARFYRFLLNHNGIEIHDDINLQQYIVDDTEGRLKDGTIKQEGRTDTFLAPGMQSRYHRVLPDDAAFTPFLAGDPISTVLDYVRESVKRAEFERRFGEHSTVRHPQTRKLHKVYDPSGRLKRMIASSGATPKDRTYALRVVDAHLGRLGSEMHPTLRSVQDAVITYQNFRVLGGSGFSAMMDFAGVLMRSDGKLLDSFTTLLRVIRKDFKEDEKAILDMAAATGITGEFLTMHGIHEMFDNHYMSSGMHKANDALFRYNGTRMVTEALRRTATLMAIRDIQNDAHNESKHGARRLKELGLTADDVKAWEARGSKPWMGELDKYSPERKVQQAVSKWVDESVLRPSASTRPLLTSDRRLGLITHLKGFMWNWHRVVNVRMYEEARHHGNLRPMVAIIPLLAITALSLELRQLLQYSLWGETQPSDRLDAVDYMWELSQRSGIAGPFQTVFDMDEQMGRGKSVTGALLGPTFSHLNDLSAKPIDTFLSSSVPGLSFLHGLRRNLVE